MPFKSVSGGNTLYQIKRVSEQSEGHKSNTFTRTLGERRQTFKDEWGWGEGVGVRQLQPTHSLQR